MSTDAHSFDSAILSAVVAPQSPTLAPDVAKALLAWQFNASETERMRELADKNRQESLTDLEREELESFLRVGEFLNLVHAKARISLAADVRGA
jgi:hypothetical protein